MRRRIGGVLLLLSALVVFFGGSIKWPDLSDWIPAVQPKVLVEVATETTYAKGLKEKATEQVKSSLPDLAGVMESVAAEAGKDLKGQVEPLLAMYRDQGRATLGDARWLDLVPLNDELNDRLKQLKEAGKLPDAANLGALLMAWSQGLK